MIIQENRISQHIDTEGTEVARRMQEAKMALKDLQEGKDFMLPTDRELLGSLTFWREIHKGLVAYGDGTQAVEAITQVIDILDNGGAIREQTLLQVKDAINRTVETYRESPQKMAA